MYVHVVFLSFRNEAREEEKNRVAAMLRFLSWSARESGASHWSVSENNDRRPKPLIGGRAVDIVVMGNFPNHEAFTVWRDSSDHKKFAEALGKMPVDWLVGDVLPVNLVKEG